MRPALCVTVQCFFTDNRPELPVSKLCPDWTRPSAWLEFAAALRDLAYRGVFRVNGVVLYDTQGGDPHVGETSRAPPARGDVSIPSKVAAPLLIKHTLQKVRHSQGPRSPPSPTYLLERLRYLTYGTTAVQRAAADNA